MPKRRSTQVASGFNRLGALRKNAGNQEVASSRNEVLTEMTNIVGAAFLGVTLGCARCHDHKFDPIRHTDYYRIQGYFAQTQAHDIMLASEQEQKDWKAKSEPTPARDAAYAAQHGQSRRARRKQKLEQQIEELEDKMPPPLTALYTVQGRACEADADPRAGARRAYEQRRSVGMRPLGRSAAGRARPKLPLEAEKPRLKLAQWITDPANPLTARVMVNRIWDYHFGRGIVSDAERLRPHGLAPVAS